MRTMYHKCKLVHADLSEYNILYYRGLAYIIDVSQAIEHDHPNAMEFLRMDCANITQFFGHRHGLAVLTARELFDFITDPAIADDDVPQVLAALLAQSDQRSSATLDPSTQVDDAVFQRSFIPRTIDEVDDIEGDMARVRAGDATDIYYQKVLGLNPLLIAPVATPSPATSSKRPAGPPGPSSSQDAASIPASSDPAAPGMSGGDDSSAAGWVDHENPTPDEVKAARKANKKKVKEENRTRRQNKIPKALKKKKIKQSAGQKKKHK
jgi:RIO kinase 1